jgi:GT2 family glycosyltransferase
VVIVARDEGAHLARTVHALLATIPADGEVIVVDDHSSDGSARLLADRYPSVPVLRPPHRIGGAAARNLGALRAAGQLLVFSDAHVEPPGGWVDALGAALDAPGAGAVAPAVAQLGDGRSGRGYGLTWRAADMTLRWLPRRSTDPYPVPLVSVCFCAMRRATFDEFGGFDDALAPWGGTDAEMGMRLWSLGLRCEVVPDVCVRHLFRTRFPYPVAGADVLHNRLRVAAVHLTGPRLGRVLDALRPRAAFSAALARVMDEDTWERRAALHRRRRHDDTWFCRRFGITCLTDDAHEEAA